LPSVRSMGIQLFAGNVAVSHAYAHIFDIGCKVNVGGMEIKPGDLLHGDRHGALNVPIGIAPQIPAVASKLERRHQKIIELCRSSSFSVEKLSEMLETIRKSG
jgi:4-hydroxy-4-methyl-2-oxoglutarate aldolase